MLSKLKEILNRSEVGRLYLGVVSNAVSLGSLQLFNYLIPVVTVPYLVRTLGVERFGAIAFAGAFVQYLIRVTDYGFNLSATREVAVRRGDALAISKITSAVFAIRCLLATACIAAGIVATYLSKSLAHERPLVLVTLLSVVGAALSTTYLFQGMERMQYITVLGIGSKVLYFLGLVALVHNKADYIWVPALSGFCDIAAGVAGCLVAFRTFGVGFSIPGYSLLKEQLTTGWAVFTSMLAITAYAVTPTFAIGMYADVTAAGYYAIAERILTPLQLFPLGAIVAALYPRLSHLHSISPGIAYRMMRKSQNVTTALYAVFTPILIILAPFFVSWVSGSQYPTSVLILRILLVSVFFVQANAFQLQFLLVAGAGRTYARIHIVTALFGCLSILVSARIFSLVGPAVCQSAISAVILVWTSRAIPSLAIPVPTFLGRLPHADGKTSEGRAKMAAAGGEAL